MDETLSDLRRRIELAHLIGHHVERQCVANQHTGYSFRCPSREPNLHEYFASWFAGALIMPASKVRELHPDMSGIDHGCVFDIAATFNVTYLDALDRVERVRRMRTLMATLTETADS